MLLVPIDKFDLLDYCWKHYKDEDGKVSVTINNRCYVAKGVSQIFEMAWEDFQNEKMV